MPAPPNFDPTTFNLSAKRPAPVAAQQPTRPSIHLDWENWLPYFEGSSLSEEEKQNQIEALWSIVLAFVDLGWGVHDPDVSESCGQVTDLTALLAAAVVESKTTNDSTEDA